MSDVVETDWQAVLARTAAFLCLQQADMSSASVLDKAEFLMRFGIPRSDAARILGTTDESLRVSGIRRRKAGGKKRTTSGRSKAKPRISKKASGTGGR
jgi:hypothetical protein